MKLYTAILTRNDNGKPEMMYSDDVASLAKQCKEKMQTRAGRQLVYASYVIVLGNVPAVYDWNIE